MMSSVRTIVLYSTLSKFRNTVCSSLKYFSSYWLQWILYMAIVTSMRTLIWREAKRSGFTIIIQGSRVRVRLTYSTDAK